MTAGPSTLLELEGVSKAYGSISVLSNLSLQLREHEFLSIIGPSGSGKSTILKLMAGIIRSDQGRVLYRGKDVAELPLHQVGIVMVWQSLALFPHLNVEDNLSFGLSVRRVAETERQRRVNRFLDLVDLQGFQNRSIDELSGGEKQRVALARALILEPEVVLLDEPLSGLDKEIRAQLLAKLREIHRNMSVTFVMVTHDHAEAMFTSSRIAILHRGGIEQIGTPREVTYQPKSHFVARFIGRKNIFTGQVKRVEDGFATVQTAAGLLTARIPDWSCVVPKTGEMVAYVVDAPKVNVGSDRGNCIAGRLDVRALSGAVEILEVINPDLGLVRSEQVLRPDWRPGSDERVELSWSGSDAYILLRD